jgi:uncharacterized protein
MPGIFERLRNAREAARKPNRFIHLLTEQAGTAVEACDILVRYMKDPSAANAQELRKAEKNADEIRRILIDDLLHTFVTPIDREDIFALSRAIDDIVDYTYSTADEMYILGVEPNEYLKRIATLLRDAAEEIKMAMERLERHPNIASEHAQRAKALENRVETVYREALADLFKGPEDLKHIVAMLKLRETYRHMSNAADRGDEAANLIHDIVIKLS